MPTITRIAESKRSPKQRRIYLDGAYSFGCSINVVARFKLREGLALSAEQVEQVKLGQVRQECLDFGLRYLQLRLHSRAELSKKLTRKEFDQTTINGVLDDLTRLGYIDDARFARTRASAAAEHKRHGPNRARLELMKAGVERETARRAVEDVYEATDALSVARSLAEKQLPRLSRLDPQVARRRLYGMLLRRGFDYDTVRPIVEEVLGRSHTSDEE